MLFSSDLEKGKNRADLATVLYEQRLKDELANLKTVIEPIRQGIPVGGRS